MKKNHARFLDNILTELRPEPEYFRVGYYGRGFPSFLRNKVFIYRGLEYEKIGTFTNRLQSEFPQSSLLKKSGPPDETILNSEGQFLQICNVKPVPEPRPEFEGRDVPDKILAYYLTNDVRTFIFDRPIHKGPADPENEFKSLWIERSTLTTCDKLPGTLRWSEVVQKRVTELSPLEHACESVENMNRELERLVQSYMTDPGKLISPLSMRLQGVIEAAVNGGIAKYQDAFFNPKYINLHPEQGAYIRRLKQLIMQKVRILEGGLSIHGRHAPVSIQPLHMRLVERFSLMRQNILDSTSHVVDSSIEILPKRPSILNTPLPPIPGGHNNDARRRRAPATTTTTANNNSSSSFAFSDETDDLYSLVSGAATGRRFDDDIYSVPLERTIQRDSGCHSLPHIGNNLELVMTRPGDAPLIPDRNSPAPPPPPPPIRPVRYSDGSTCNRLSPATPPPTRPPLPLGMNGGSSGSDSGGSNVLLMSSSSPSSQQLQRTRSMPRSMMGQQQQPPHSAQSAAVLTVGNSNFYSPDPTSRSSPTNLMSPISAPPLPPRSVISNLERHRSVDAAAAAIPEDMRPNLPKRTAVRKAISSAGQMERTSGPNARNAVLAPSSSSSSSSSAIEMHGTIRNGTRRPAPCPPATQPPLLCSSSPPQSLPPVLSSDPHLPQSCSSVTKVPETTTAATTSSSCSDQVSGAAASADRTAATACAATAAHSSIIPDHEVKSLPDQSDVSSFQKEETSTLTIKTCINEVTRESVMSAAEAETDSVAASEEATKSKPEIVDQKE
jgi:dedicator of cytokinesis protein 3